MDGEVGRLGKGGDEREGEERVEKFGVGRFAIRMRENIGYDTF